MNYVNTPKSLVHEYIQKFGGKVLNKNVIYGKFTDGPFSGKYTGERKYQVNFTDVKRHMGIYHFLDGARIGVYYRGNIKTCGRCHSSAYHCPGGALAGVCEEKGGEMITLICGQKSIFHQLLLNYQKWLTTSKIYQFPSYQVLKAVIAVYLKLMFRPDLRFAKLNPIWIGALVYKSIIFLWRCQMMKYSAIDKNWLSAHMFLLVL